MSQALRILLIDDNPDDRLLVVRELARHLPAAAVSEIADARQLDEALEAGAFDAALTDYQLRWSNGIEVLRRIKARRPDCPVIMFTGTGSEEVAVEAMKSGLDDYVLKTSSHYALLPKRIGALLERARQTSAIRQKEQTLRLYAKMFENTAEGLVVCDAQNNIIEINPAFSQITGYSAQEALGGTPAMLNSGRHDRQYFQNMWGTLLDTGRWEGEIWNRRKNGEIYPEWLRITALRGEGNEISHYVAMFSDITERKQVDERIRYLAQHDALTGLPNRALLLDRTWQALVKAGRDNTQVAVLFIDLDRFKVVNDSLGHQVGDLLLQSAAERMSGCLREEDTLARHGGDEFVCVAPQLHNAQDAALIARKIIEAMAQPHVIGEHVFNITPSIGISLYPGDAADVETLLKNADGAMYRAKAEGGNAYHFSTPDLTASAYERFMLENQLRDAVKDSQFVLHYHPQVNIASGRIIGMECLVRWLHPQMGVVPPAKFIPLAEETGLIGAIGEWVLHTACAQNRKWQDKGLPRLPVAVNLSARQFVRQNLAETVSRVLDETGLDPRDLELEITESTLMREVETMTEIMGEIGARGVKFSVDDFGTGYSSLSYLKRFPISTLKIDQSFVKGIPASADDSAISGAIIAMAHNLGMRVIAEGVEKKAQLEFLAAHRCHGFQGYYFSKPLPGGEFARLLGGAAL